MGNRRVLDCQARADLSNQQAEEEGDEGDAEAEGEHFEGLFGEGAVEEGGGIEGEENDDGEDYGEHCDKGDRHGGKQKEGSDQ